MSHFPQGSDMSVRAKDRTVGAIRNTCQVPADTHTGTHIRSVPYGGSSNRADPSELHNSLDESYRKQDT